MLWALNAPETQVILYHIIHAVDLIDHKTWKVSIFIETEINSNDEMTFAVNSENLNRL